MKYQTVCRNLKELESIIRSIFSGAEGDVEGCRQRFVELADDIERKVEFLKSHIAAESGSHPPDHHLSLLSRRIEAIHFEFRRMKDNILLGLPFDCPHYLDDPPPSSSDDESCCFHVDQHHEESGPATFRVYDNPLAFDGCDYEDDQDVPSHGDVKEGGEQRIEKCVAVVGNGEGKWWMYWRPMVVSVVVGGVSVAVAVVSVVVRYGVWCDFSDNDSISVFPPPT